MGTSDDRRATRQTLTSPRFLDPRAAGQYGLERLELRLDGLGSGAWVELLGHPALHGGMPDVTELLRSRQNLLTPASMTKRYQFGIMGSWP